MQKLVRTGRATKPAMLSVPVSEVGELHNLVQLFTRCDPANKEPIALEPLSWSVRKSIAKVLWLLVVALSDKRPAHRPANQQRAFWAALLVFLRRQGESIAEAKDRIGKRWNLSTEVMRRAWLDHHHEAAQIAGGSKDSD